MIRTWSLEECVIRAASTAAVAAQGLWDVVTRRPGPDWDRPVDGRCQKCLSYGYCYFPDKCGRGDGADELTDSEVEIDTHEPAACECFVTDEKYWFRYGSAVEPGSQMEWNPDCPAHRVADTPNPVRNPALAMHNELDELCAYTDPDHSMVTEVCGVCRPVRDICEQMIEERFPPTFSAATVVGEGPNPCGQSAGPGVGRNSFPAAVTPPAAGDWTQQIADVLSEHQPRDRGLGIHCKGADHRVTHAHCDDWPEWRQHVAQAINEQLRFSK